MGWRIINDRLKVRASPASEASETQAYGIGDCPAEPVEGYCSHSAPPYVQSHLSCHRLGLSSHMDRNREYSIGFSFDLLPLIISIKAVAIYHGFHPMSTHRKPSSENGTMFNFATWETSAYGKFPDAVVATTISKAVAANPEKESILRSTLGTHSWHQTYVSS